MRGAALLVLALWAGSAAADPLDRSMRPQPRPVERVVAAAARIAPAALQAAEERIATLSVQAVALSPRPNARDAAPAAAPRAAAPAAAADPAQAATLAFAEPAPVQETVQETAQQAASETVSHSPRPAPRSRTIVEQGRRQQELLRRGAVCGDPAIQGDAVGNVAGPGDCGIDNAVRVRSVAGITLSTPALMDCGTAAALKDWVQAGVQPVLARTGGGLASVHVIGHYACRGRIGTVSSKLSQHSFGNAIDIAGFRLRDGREVTVQNGWNSKGAGAALRQMHGAACGRFGTVLGPNANAAHRDHFHLDTASYRSGAYCR